MREQVRDRLRAFNVQAALNMDKGPQADWIRTHLAIAGWDASVGNG